MWRFASSVVLTILELCLTPVITTAFAKQSVLGLGRYETFSNPLSDYVTGVGLDLTSDYG